MDATMIQNTKRELLEKLRWRYATAGLEHRRKLIDQAVELMGYHRTTGPPRGVAFITMSSPEEAQKAINAMNGAKLDGQ